MNEIRHTQEMLFEQIQVNRALVEQINLLQGERHQLHHQHQIGMHYNYNQSGGELQTEPFALRRTTGAEYRGYNRTFNSDEYSFNYEIQTNLTTVAQLVELKNRVDTFFQQIFTDAFALGGENDVFSITINHSTFDKPLYVHVSKRDFTIDRVHSQLLKLTQSNSRWIELNREPLVVHIKVFRRLLGHGKRQRLPDKKYGVYEIVNDDHMCGYYAVTLSLILLYSKRDSRMMDKNCRWQ